MSSSQQRIRLLVDVFAKKNQKADALPSLVPAELVEAILQEFQGEKDLEYLSNTPELYYLLRASDRSPLDENTPLGQQVSDQEQLVLAEQEMPLPNGTQRPTQPIYMREQTAEQATSQVYKLHWLPAIIAKAGAGRYPERYKRTTGRGYPYYRLSWKHFESRIWDR
jgi:hypothetical protein